MVVAEYARRMEQIQVKACNTWVEAQSATMKKDVIDKVKYLRYE